ncbi:MAG TPA: hypothetical protein PKY10_07455 [Lentisphaeria bacterium]|nr:hypothetical protein [Lentisphaeria bacterium]
MTDKGEKLLLYPQITLMAQVFSGCVVGGNQPRSGKNTKSAKHTAG